MREIVLDTETTGLDPLKGDRIVEIGCLELHNLLPTGRTYQAYINPERPMNPGASAVSGLTDDFLVDKPLIRDVIESFLDFIGEAPLVIHNASFDMRFLNAELVRLKRPSLQNRKIIDTLQMARKKFPGSPASLDALCKRFGIDLSKRGKHGALLDSELLSQVYLELKGGRQQNLSLKSTITFSKEQTASDQAVPLDKPIKVWPQRDLRHQPSEEEKKSHQTLLKDITQPLWENLGIGI